MNKIIQIRVFNDILDQFFHYLQTNFPYFRSDIILAQSTVGFIQKNNPRLVVEQFMSHILEYKQHIFDCDEQFFLNFEDNCMSDEAVKNNFLTCMKIKNVWTSDDITNEQKAYIWLYLQKLIRSGEKVLM